MKGALLHYYSPFQSLNGPGPEYLLTFQVKRLRGLLKKKVTRKYYLSARTDWATFYRHWDELIKTGRKVRIAPDGYIFM